MLADEDNPLDADVRDPSVVVAEPQLVVIYRSRGVPWMLIPPLLIVAAVVGIIVYRKSTPIPHPRPVVSTALTIEPTNPVIPDPKPPVADVGTPAPEVPEQPATPAEPIPVAALPTADPPPIPVEPSKRDPVGFDPEAAKVELPGATGPPRSLLSGPENPTMAPVRDPEPPTVDRPDTPLANFEDQNLPKSRNELIAQSLRRAAADRGPFHDDVRRLLKEVGNRAGPEIKALCDRYGRDTMPEILYAMNRDLVGPAARLSPIGRVQRMRRWGVPETIILDDLAEVEESNLKSRGGPKNKGEAWIRAARVLISIPPNSTPAGSPRPK